VLEVDLWVSDPAECMNQVVGSVSSDGKETHHSKLLEQLRLVCPC